MNPGDTFGCLTVSMPPYKVLVSGRWRMRVDCTCSCGAAVNLLAKNLRHGPLFCRSCSSQWRRRKAMEKALAELRPIYFGWTVTGQPSHSDAHTHTNLLVPVRCACGHEAAVRFSALKAGLSKSCGRCEYRAEMRRGLYHVVTDINLETREAVCSQCGPTHAVAAGLRRSGRYAGTTYYRCGKRAMDASRLWFEEHRDKNQKRFWHQINDVDVAAMTGTCSLCGPSVFVVWRGQAFKCASDQNRRVKAENQRVYRLWRVYGITPHEYEQMLERQDGKCRICGSTTSRRSDSDKRLVVDHCHATGRVRGLLCDHCNKGIGHFDDDVDKLLSAAAYIEETQAVAA